MILPDEPLYLPFKPGPFRMSKGLVVRDPDAFLDDLGGANAEPARDVAADVGPVAAIGQGREPLALVMEWTHQLDVHQVRASA